MGNIPLSPKTTQLLLIRHGETDWNHEGRWQGQIDIALNQKGREQADQTAKQLKERPIEAIYSSDLQRASQTANILAKAKGLNVQMDARLREIHQGEWQGLLVSEIEARHAALYEQRSKDPYAFAPPGGESTSQVRERVIDFLREIKDRHMGETVAIVSHGFVLAVMQAIYQTEPTTNLFSLVPQNGEIITLDLR